MKHIKKYENVEDYKFDIDDLVVCVNSNWPVVGLKSWFEIYSGT